MKARISSFYCNDDGDTLRRQHIGLLHVKVFLLASILIGTWGTTCHAATGEPSLERLSRIWQQEFPVPSADLAPSTLRAANPAPKAGVLMRSGRPHPAVARIIVPESGATSYGSGTLIDVRDSFGLVITNWHVVRDASGTIEVVFPDGFSSKARALKVDADWDLAALIIWRPSVEPVAIASVAPRPGDALTICGYGPGSYRAQTGRCTQYYAPRLDFPRHMVELDVEARQGDSGGPIFNEQGELAGVLFGAGQGTTLGSFGGRVEAFLSSLAPDIGQAEQALATQQACEQGQHICVNPSAQSMDPFAQQTVTLQPHIPTEASDEIAKLETNSSTSASAAWPSDAWPQSSEVTTPTTEVANQDTAETMQMADEHRPSTARRDGLFEQVKTALAAVGLLAIVVQVLRVAR